MIDTGNANTAQSGNWRLLNQTPRKNVVIINADLRKLFKKITSILFADSTDSDKSTLDNSSIPESINLVVFQSVVLSDR